VGDETLPSKSCGRTRNNLKSEIPNNVVLMRNNAAVVVDDISQDPQGRNIFKIFGPKFDLVYPEMSNDG
jgi:hypothetical protein